MLFITDLGTIGAALFALVAVVYIAMRASQLGGVLAPRAFLLAIPLLAILSTMWSEAPAVTLKYSLEFALTIGAALTLSAAPQSKAVLWGLCLAFGCYVGTALMFGQIVDTGTVGATAFSGLTDSKNLLADIAATGLLVSTAVLIAGIEDRRLWRSALAVLFIAIEAYALFEARSAGALLACIIAAVIFVFLICLRPLSVVLRVTAIGLLSLGLALMALAYNETSGGLMDAIAQLFGKDTTFTGRTYLWQRASDFIAEKPLLGKGFNAFWLRGNPDAEGLWRYAGIVSREGFSFHNTFIEILVHLGWVGLIVFGATILVGAGFLFCRAVVRPNLSLCFWSSLVVYELVRTPVEVVGVTQFYFSTVLLFTALGSAFVARRVSRESDSVRQTRYRPRPARPVFARSSLAKPSSVAR
ncbi:MAG TPA: O-antigen ligase family protein [Stellaceae bacterium]|nr:O-antigen ligase family protein [Stellaceae bacterium]